jgi:hypothetical protein
MSNLPMLEARLFAAFPQVRVHGVIAPHECEECDALRQVLGPVTWDGVPPEFIRENDGALPLLSQEAYVTFLPAWLREALNDPSGFVAGQLLVNLRHEPRTNGFTREQSLVIVDVARFIANSNVWGRNDPVNVESLAAIESAWGAYAA